MKPYKSVKEQLLEYYMAQDHTPYTDTGHKSFKSYRTRNRDYPLEKEYEDINIVVAIPREENLELISRQEMEASLNPMSTTGTPLVVQLMIDLDDARAPRYSNTTYQSGPLGGSYQSGKTYGYKKFRVPRI
ncbi:hypothetical protein H0E87_031603 [Populus deltoides]|uniref:Uncharacterized protein n=1 Tax=Populus deltoides TaxID=3696 RepID=A0A8T2WDS5_POPDE|nr:hypothetical protein H0E87_031603 [Populus deltoides]